jgi:hypothetical protein
MAIDKNFDQEMKEKWLAALKSGEYKKGKGRLCAKNFDYIDGVRVEVFSEFCCLGVLAEINGDLELVSDTSNILGIRGVNGYNSYTTLYLGKKDNVQHYAYNFDHSAMNKLIDINDSQSTFDGVIQYIEENL